jgi:monoamine oxidase
VAEGLGTVVASFAHGVPIKLSTAVRKIEWGDEGVVVTAGGQRYRAEKLVITVPTGVLASGQIEFDPPLPAWKQAAIEALPMGQFEKVALTFERGALPHVPAATHVAPLDADARVGDLPMELVLRPFDSDAVVGFVGGDVARTLAEQGREAAIDRAVDRLARMYGDGVRTQVLRSFVTEWGQDPWARGAYSAAKPGLAHMRERLAKPVDDTLYFAGEAAHVEWAQCVPGAYLTGRDAGRAIAERLAAARARLGAA